jgi:hypothetical protein
LFVFILLQVAKLVAEREAERTGFQDRRVTRRMAEEFCEPLLIFFPLFSSSDSHDDKQLNMDACSIR